jgi:hypothetical protein
VTLDVVPGFQKGKWRLKYVIHISGGQRGGLGIKGSDAPLTLFISVTHLLYLTGLSEFLAFLELFLV